MKHLKYLFLLCLVSLNTYAQPLSAPVQSAKPLDKLLIANAFGKTISVSDGAGRVYFSSSKKPLVGFTVGGALGKHTVNSTDAKGKKTLVASFDV